MKQVFSRPTVLTTCPTMSTLPQQDVDLEAQTPPHDAGSSSSSVISTASPGVASGIPNPIGRVSYEASSAMAATLSGRQLLSETLIEDLFTRQQNDQLPTRESQFRASHGIVLDIGDAGGTRETPENGEEMLADVATTQDQTTTQWNGHPSDWASWPNGRPSPFISDHALKHYRSLIGDVTTITTEAENRMKTDELVFHVAEFTQSGEGETLVVDSSRYSHQEF